MYKCEICGKDNFKKIRYGGYTLCSKHMHQLQKYGKFLDNIPRTNNDLNDYIIKNDIVYFNLYNQKNQKIGTFFIDLEDIEKIKYKKWRISHNHVVTGLPAKGNQRDISHIILDIPKEEYYKIVDHIDGNGFNNRKNNLRICEQKENVLNKSFMSNNTSGFIGVSFRKDREYYDPEIRLGYIRCHLGYTKEKIDAVYKRYVAEELLFKDFVNEEEHKKKYEFTKSLPKDRKQELFNIVIEKLRNKNLWQ